MHLKTVLPFLPVVWQRNHVETYTGSSTRLYDLPIVLFFFTSHSNVLFPQVLPNSSTSPVEEHANGLQSSLLYDQQCRSMHAYSGQEVVSATCSFLSQASPSLLEILLCSCSAVKIGPNLALLQQR